jgi:hypothetical protein
MPMGLEPRASSEIDEIKGYINSSGMQVQGLASRYGYTYDASTPTFKKQ